LSTKELATTLCACANTDGGTVHIGVTDSGGRNGVRVTPPLLDAVRNAAR
jgi:predicted HTH transcriptional regulator